MATINFSQSTRNILGTMTFVCKFGKMRKEQEFSVYPISETCPKILLQSEHRWAEIDRDGNVEMSANRAQYANRWTLIEDRAKGRAEKDVLTAEQWATMKARIRETAGNCVGSSFVFSDNSAAASI